MENEVTSRSKSAELQKVERRTKQNQKKCGKGAASEINGWLQSTHYEFPKQGAAPEPQKRTESNISIPSLGLFDTNNPVYDPAEEDFRRRM